MKKQLFFAKVARHKALGGSRRKSQTFDGSPLRKKFQSCARALKQGGLLWAGAAGALALLACFFLIYTAQDRTAFGPHAVVAVRLDAVETATESNQPFGLDTSYPLLPVRSGAFGQKGFSVPHAFTGTAVRFDVMLDELAPGRRDFSANTVPAARSGLLRFAHGTVSIDTEDGPVPVFRLRRSSRSVGVREQDLFETDYFNGGRTVLQGVPRRTGGGGVSLGWAASEARLCDERDDRSEALLRALVRGLSVPGEAPYTAANSVSRYKPYVQQYAEKYGLATALVLAIMHTESNFNPFAVSRSRAVGLMQIVPDTAGHEAHQYLTGGFGAPSLELLFTPEHNIRYGTAYLHLLGRRYFGGVQDGRSRQMCIIAAYNGGPGAVLRMFDPYDQDAAVARINSMSPDQVYTALTRDMPNAETRRYVELVLNRMRGYGVY